MSEYGAIQFGDISNYMKNKQAKLVNQNNNSYSVKSSIFSGLKLHVNGYTDPSLNQLRKLIIENGGVYLHYLNNRSDVTHIISNNLTPRKVIEFKNIKCCTPAWLLDSIHHGRLLSWQKYILNTTRNQPSLFNYNSPNKHAESLLQSEQWRLENTAQSDAFLDSYYTNSRLHFLSSSKETLKELVQSAQQNVQNQAADDVITTSPTTATTTILHVDMDSFFVSASLSLPRHSHLRNSPVAISHSTSQSSSSTSELASVNYAAREYGIRNGMLKSVAYQLCPHLVTLPYDFKLYNGITVKLYEILLRHSDHLQAVSVDEALLDVSQTVHKMDTGVNELAQTIRNQIHTHTRCTASVGIGSSILLARLATRHAKPDGIFHLHDARAKEFLAPLPFDSLPGVGGETKRKLVAQLGVSTIGELLAHRNVHDVQNVLGKKSGETLWKYCNAIDQRPLSSDRKRQSVSAEVNYGIRFENVAETQKFFANLSTELSRRLRGARCRAGQLTVKIMVRRGDAPKEAAKFLGHGVVDTLNKSANLSAVGGDCTDDHRRIYECAWRVFMSLGKDVRELRGVGLQVAKLEHYREGDEDVKQGGKKEKEKGKGKDSIQKFFKKPNQPKESQPPQAGTLNALSTSKHPQPHPKPQTEVIDISSDFSMDTSVDDSTINNKEVNKLNKPTTSIPKQTTPPSPINIDDSLDTSDDSITSTTTMPTQADRAVWKAIPRSIRKEVLDERARVQNALRTPFKVPFKVDKKAEIENAKRDKGNLKRSVKSDDVPQSSKTSQRHQLDRLDYNTAPTKSMNIPTNTQTHYTANTSAMPPPTPSITMLPSQVDAGVWRDLPSEIRKEVLSDRQGSRGSNKRVAVAPSPDSRAQPPQPASTPHSAIPATPLPTPSVSLKPTQADAEVWRALPSTIRKEILGERMAERQKGLGDGIRDNDSVGSTSTNTLSTSALSSPSLALPNSQIDGGVWRELPSSVRRNLFEEINRERSERKKEKQLEKEKEKKERASHTHTHTIHTQITHKSQLVAQRSKSAVLMHRTEMGDIMAVMETWLDVFKEHGPHTRDVNRVKLYIRKSLTEDTEGMAKTRLLLKMWKRKHNEYFGDGVARSLRGDSDLAEKWLHAFEDVRQCVDEIVIHKWGCRLSLK